MKKYVLFTYPFYYPNGGMGDISDSFNSLKEAIDHAIPTLKAKAMAGEWEIVDRDTWAILEHGRLDFEP